MEKKAVKSSQKTAKGSQGRNGKAGQPSIKKPQVKKPKIAIVGYAPSSMMLAPFNDPEWEIWGVNEIYKIAPKRDDGSTTIDVLFEMHEYKWLENKVRNPQHLEWLRKNKKVSVLMLEHYPEIPMSIRYPIEEIKEKYGDYFTNSISYMLAMAINLGVPEIGLWGVDMATDEEYQFQRPSVEYFVGIAKGAGIKVRIPAQCDLLKTFNMYGYDDETQTRMVLKVKARDAELQGRIMQYQNNMLNARDQMNQMVGAKDNMAFFKRVWGKYGDPWEGRKENVSE